MSFKLVINVYVIGALILPKCACARDSVNVNIIKPGLLDVAAYILRALSVFDCELN